MKDAGRESEDRQLLFILSVSLSQMGASCGEVDVVCLCEAAPCTLYSEAHTPTPVSAQPSHLSVCGHRSECFFFSVHAFRSLLTFSQLCSSCFFLLYNNLKCVVRCISEMWRFNKRFNQSLLMFPGNSPMWTLWKKQGNGNQVLWRIWHRGNVCCVCSKVTGSLYVCMQCRVWFTGLQAPEGLIFVCFFFFFEGSCCSVSRMTHGP